jgi:hypothetical protein
MAGTPYLVDSNVLLRWVKPDDRDYPRVVSAIDSTLQRGAVFCYTSQNVAEFWNTCTRPLDRNGYGAFSPGSRSSEDEAEGRPGNRRTGTDRVARFEWLLTGEEV